MQVAQARFFQIQTHGPHRHAAPERIMSLLTAMDKPSARTTKADTLRQVLFLRGNSEMVRALLHRGALERAASTERQRSVFAKPGEGASGGYTMGIPLSEPFWPKIIPVKIRPGDGVTGCKSI